MSRVSYKSSFPARSAAFKAAVPLIVDKTAADATRIARAKSRVDTGAMEGNWTYEMESLFRAIIGNPEEHSIYNEYGTVKMSAQPMIRPAIGQVTDAFFAAMTVALNAETPLT